MLNIALCMSRAYILYRNVTPHQAGEHELLNLHQTRSIHARDTSRAQKACLHKPMGRNGLLIEERKPPEQARRRKHHKEEFMSAEATAATATATVEAPPKKKKKFSVPTAFTILFVITILAVVATWFIPAGAYSKLAYLPESSGSSRSPSPLARFAPYLQPKKHSAPTPSCRT